MFLLISDSSSNDLHQSGHPKTYLRKDYITLTVSGDLKTPLSPNLPITITDKEQSFIIKNAYLIGEVNTKNSETGFSFTSEQSGIFQKKYIIQLHQSKFHFIQNKSQLIFYPHNIKLTKRVIKGRHYEVIF